MFSKKIKAKKFTKNKFFKFKFRPLEKVPFLLHAVCENADFFYQPIFPCVT